jgi:hypothetical protein
MLDRAKFLVVSEITEVMGQQTADIETQVDAALERCFATKAKNTVRPKAAVAPSAPPARTPKAVAAAATPAPRVASKVTSGRTKRAS